MTRLIELHQQQIDFWKQQEAFEKDMAKRHSKRAVQHHRYWKKIEKQMEKLK